ncbi:MAG TPA: glycine cleavage system aminomethyltransferase GcvT [Pirellulales bacterium]
MPAQTPLHDWHAAHGGRMVDFAGWSMPVQYTSIVDEHRATRSAVGLFDVSHMGRLRFKGPEGLAFLDRVLTRDIRDTKPGQVRYSLITNDEGGILDDVLVYATSSGPSASYLLVVNAGNRDKIVAWLNAHRASDEFSDETRDSAMIAVQGPRALEVLKALLPFDAARLRYYGCTSLDWDGAPTLLSRTGYTGEDGCELILPASVAQAKWEQLVAAAADCGGRPAGLGARDTLRLEAGMPLYGHELTEEIDPYQAGLQYAVSIKDRTFPGSGVLASKAERPGTERRAGWVLEGKRVPREGYAVFYRGEPVGRVTSGTFSPTLERPIAMGYVPAELAAPGTQVEIDIRGHRAPGETVRLPFYRRSS